MDHHIEPETQTVNEIIGALHSNTNCLYSGLRETHNQIVHDCTSSYLEQKYQQLFTVEPDKLQNPH